MLSVLSFLWGMLFAVLIFGSCFGIHLVIDAATVRDDE